MEVSTIDACKGSSYRSSKYEGKRDVYLAFSVVYTLQKDPAGHLWVSSPAQLSHIHGMVVTGHPLYRTVAGRQIPDSFTIIRIQNSDYLSFILQAWL